MADDKSEEKNDDSKKTSAEGAEAAPSGDNQKKLLIIVGAVCALVGILNIFFMLRTPEQVTVGAKRGNNKFSGMSVSQAMQLNASQADLVPKKCGLDFQKCTILCKDKSHVKACKSCWYGVKECVERYKNDPDGN